MTAVLLNANDSRQTAAPDPTDDEFITSGSLRAELGGISDQTLWRWQKDPTLNFPEPRIIRGRRYWRRSDVAAFKAA